MKYMDLTIEGRASIIRWQVLYAAALDLTLSYTILNKCKLVV